MSAKTILVLCAQVFLLQSIAAQYLGAPCGAAWGPAPCAGAPLAEWAYAPAATLAASNGPGLAISTASPRVPAGVSVLSENAYEGALAVGGALPFLGTVALEGALPTAGAGAVSYGCGNGAVAITAEDARGYAGQIGAIGYDRACPLGYGSVLDAPLGYGRACPLGYGSGLDAPLGYGRVCPLGYGSGLDAPLGYGRACPLGY